MVLYEYPFNESIRTMLRLEHLFDRLGQLIPRDAPVDHHFALATLFEIMDVASRADLKSDLLKELDRHKGLLNAYRGNPSISEQALDQVVGTLDRAFTGLVVPDGGLADLDGAAGVLGREAAHPGSLILVRRQTVRRPAPAQPPGLMRPRPPDGSDGRPARRASRRQRSSRS